MPERRPKSVPFGLRQLLVLTLIVNAVMAAWKTTDNPALTPCVAIGIARSAKLNRLTTDQSRAPPGVKRAVLVLECHGVTSARRGHICSGCRHGVADVPSAAKQLRLRPNDAAPRRAYLYWHWPLFVSVLPVVR